MMLEKNIVAALAQVKDHQSGQDIISANFVRDLQIKGAQVNFTLELPSAHYEGKLELHVACVQAIHQQYPQAEVNIHIAARNAQAPKVERLIPQVKNIIAVASGKGGVGKSTVATNLAIGLSNMGARVGLLDCDLYGPSIPTMLGLQGKRPRVEDIHGQPKIIPLGAFGLAVMSIGFVVEPEQAVVLRGPRLAAIVRQFLQECAWPPLDYLVIDLPPGTGDIQLTLVQSIPLTGVVMVTTPQEVAVIDAVKAMNMFLLPNVNVPILGVVENMAWFTPTELPDNKYYIFGTGGGKKLAKMSQSMLLGQVPLVQSVREGGDEGKPAIMQPNSPVKQAFQDIAEQTARQVALRNELLAPTNMVHIKE